MVLSRYCRAVSVPICLLAISACTFIDVRDEVRYDPRGQFLLSSVRQKVQPNVTNSDWILENLGEPNAIIDNADGSTTWLYNYQQKRYQRTHVFLIFSYRTEIIEPRQFMFTIDNDKVVAMGRGEKRRPRREKPPHSQPQHQTKPESTQKQSSKPASAEQNMPEVGT